MDAKAAVPKVRPPRVSCLHLSAGGAGLQLRPPTGGCRSQADQGRPCYLCPGHLPHRLCSCLPLPPQGQGGDKPTRKMFVGGLSDISDAEFRAHFVPYGTIMVRASAPAG